jgi:hypothetical protein
MAVSGIRDLTDMIGELGEDVNVRTHFTVTVRSAEAVDRAAGLMGTDARWAMPDYYRAQKTHRGVTVTVAYCPLREVPPADDGMLGRLHDMAGASVPAGVAA